ncbi:PilZ domain-containing protein [Marinicella meishanensis]|uniref:PilZ domain-containing protein n=1 Tax=Marinicella meishanensis TaxID=2873263 RepID=UPI001CBB94EC|nr:PilZ domain-containing protein [Marinicella sp. NBU2979]
MGTIYQMSENSIQERRRFTRIPMNKTVTLFSGMEALSSQILDISLKGVLLQCPDDRTLKPGDIYRLSIPVENSPAIIMNIQVVHTNGERFGAEWTQIDMDSFAVLKRTIELNIKEKDNLRQDIKTLSE